MDRVDKTRFYPLETCYLQKSKDIPQEENVHFKLKKTTPRFNATESQKPEIKTLPVIEEPKVNDSPVSFRAKVQPREPLNLPKSRPLSMSQERKVRKSVEVIEYKSGIDVRDSFEPIHDSKTKIYRLKKDDDSKKRKRVGADDAKKGVKKVKESTATISGRFSRKQETTSPLVGNILAQINSLRTSQTTTQTKNENPADNPLIVKTIHPQSFSTSSSALSQVQISQNTSNDVSKSSGQNFETGTKPILDPTPSDPSDPSSHSLMNLLTPPTLDKRPENNL